MPWERSIVWCGMGPPCQRQLQHTLSLNAQVSESAPCSAPLGDVLGALLCSGCLFVLTPPLLPGLRSHSYLLMASTETVYPAFAIGDKVPTQLPDLKEELSGGEEAKKGALREQGIAPILNQPIPPSPGEEP